jgi:hypothetical protein
MWHEFIRINENAFRLGRQFEDELYSILDENGNIISNHKIVRWFKNGFLLAKAQEHFHHESRDGVDLSYSNCVYTILDRHLNTIYIIRVDSQQEQPTFLNFTECHLVLSNGHRYGIITDGGEIFLPFLFTKTEAEHRLTLKKPLERTSSKNIAHNEAQKIIYKRRLLTIKDTTLTKDFIVRLNNERYTEEKLFHLLLRRHSFLRRQNSYNELLPYDDAEFYLCKLDINIIIQRIQEKTKTYGLYISYWDKYNSSYDMKGLVDDLQEYFNEDDKVFLNQRILEIKGLADGLNIDSVNLERLNDICGKAIPKN